MLLAVCLAVLASRPLGAQQVGIHDGFQYQNFGTQAVLFKYVGPGGAVTMPSFVPTATGPLPVYQVAAELFKGHTGVTAVTLVPIPALVGDGMFDGCSSLTSVTLPGNLTAIAPRMFRGCGKLTSVSIPSPVASIGEEAFRDCSALTSVTLPANVTSVGASAFRNCLRLGSVSLPSGLTAIGRFSFASTPVSALTIPESVTTLGEGAFSACTAMTSVRLPSNLASIPRQLFWRCESLPTVAIPAGVTTISDEAFQQCDALTSVTLPSGLATIGEFAFLGCEVLAAPAIPASVTTIQAGAFWGCDAFTGVIIPATVTTLGDGVWADCDHLQHIDVAPANPNYRSLGGVLYDKTLSALLQVPGGKAGRFVVPSPVQRIARDAFNGCDGLTGVSLPQTLRRIDSFAFFDCGALTNVSLPAGIYVDTDAFDLCPSLESAHFEGGITGSASRPFSGVAANFTVYFHEGGQGLTAPTWKGYPSAQIPRLVISSVSRQGATVAITASGGVKNWHYALEFTSDPSTVPWAAVSTIGPLVSGGPFQLTHNAAFGAAGFYRVCAHSP